MKSERKEHPRQQSKEKQSFPMYDDNGQLQNPYKNSEEKKVPRYPDFTPIWCRQSYLKDTENDDYTLPEQGILVNNKETEKTKETTFRSFAKAIQEMNEKVVKAEKRITKLENIIRAHLQGF